MTQEGSGFTLSRSRIWSSQKCRAASLCVVLVNSPSAFSCNGRVLVPYLEFSSWYFWNRPLNGTKCHGWLVTLITQLSRTMIRRHVGPWECCSQWRPAWLWDIFGVISLRSFSSPLIPVEVLVASCLQGLSEPAKSCLKFFVMILGEPQLLPEDLYYPWPSQPIFSAPISCEQRYDTEVLVTCLDHHSLAVTSNIAGFEMKNPSNLRLRDPSEQRWVNDK